MLQAFVGWLFEECLENMQKKTVAPLLSIAGVTVTQIDTILASCKPHISVPACLGETIDPGRTEKPSLSCDLPRASKECTTYFWRRASFLKSLVSRCSAKCEFWCQIHLSDGRLGYAWKTCSKKVSSMLSLIHIRADQLGAILESCNAPVANSDCSISLKLPKTTYAPSTSAPIRVSTITIATDTTARKVTKAKMKTKKKIATTTTMCHT